MISPHHFHSTNGVRPSDSVDFYLSLGAEPMKDWTVYRITGEALKEHAK